MQSWPLLLERESPRTSFIFALQKWKYYIRIGWLRGELMQLHYRLVKVQFVAYPDCIRVDVFTIYLWIKSVFVDIGRIGGNISSRLLSNHSRWINNNLFRFIFHLCLRRQKSKRETLNNRKIRRAYGRFTVRYDLQPSFWSDRIVFFLSNT